MQRQSGDGGKLFVSRLHPMDKVIDVRQGKKCEPDSTQKYEYEEDLEGSDFASDAHWRLLAAHFFGGRSGRTSPSPASIADAG
jgi:hypothetical protein